MAMEFLGFQFFRFLARALPTRSALRMGDLLGLLAAIASTRRRRVAVENILQALPRLSRDQAEVMAVKCFQHFLRGSVEVIRCQRVLHPNTFGRHAEMANPERTNHLLDANEGAIWVTAHFGMWEVFGMYAGMRRARLTSVYRPVKNIHVDRIVRQQRARMGQELVPRKGALRALLRALRRPRSHVCLLVDQHTRRDRIWVPFFGRLAATTPAPALLALRTGAPIVVWHAVRVPGVLRFHMTCEAPIKPEPTGDRAADVERITREISQRIEAFIRKAPEQWLWLHRRWRTPPPEEVEKEEARARTPVAAT